MEIIIIAVVIVVLGFFIYKGVDSNKDGKITVNEVKAAADVNKDGKVDVKDAVAAAKKTATAAKTGAKKAVVKAKATAKRVTKKPAAKK